MKKRNNYRHWNQGIQSVKTSRKTKEEILEEKKERIRRNNKKRWGNIF